MKASWKAQLLHIVIYSSHLNEYYADPYLVKALCCSVIDIINPFLDWYHTGATTEHIIRNDNIRILNVSGTKVWTHLWYEICYNTGLQMKKM